MELSKQYKKILALTMVLLVFDQSFQANTVVNVTNINNICTATDGGTVQCKDQKLSLNSAGDLVVWNTAGLSSVDYGKIETPQDTEILFSPKSNKTLITLTPTKGKKWIKGKTIRVLFVLLPLGETAFKEAEEKELPSSVLKNLQKMEAKEPGARTMITVYRQIISKLPGEDNSEWTEVSTVGTPAEIQYVTHLKAQISPEAVATFYIKNILGEDLPQVIDLASAY